MNKPNFYLKVLSVFITAGILAACSNNQSRYIEIDQSYANMQSKNLQINYIPNVQIITKDDKLAHLIRTHKDKKFNISEENFAVLKLHIETSLIPNQLEKPQLKLVGILKKDSQEYNYKATYKLVDGIGNTIVQDEVIGITDKKIEPGKLSAKANTSAVNDAAIQIIEKLNKETQNILIDFKIVSVSDSSVYIAVNEDIKLLNNEVFLVNELPRTALNFSQLISNGLTTLAELKVITGQFPKVGMTVNLQK